MLAPLIGIASMSFADTYLGQLRQIVGNRLLMVPGTRIVIENDLGAVLLDLRPDFRLWALPGGACEPDEDAATCIVREVLEESGLAVDNVTPFGFASDPSCEITTFPNGDICRNFSLMFTTTIFSGNPRPLDGEALDYQWCDPSNPPPMVPNHRRSLDAWRRWKAGEGFQLI